MNPEHNSQPPVSTAHDSSPPDVNAKLFNVKIFHPDGSVEELQMTFPEVVQYAKANNIGFTVGRRDRPY